MMDWYNLKQKVNLLVIMAHSGILYKVQKKMPHLEIACVRLCLPLPWLSLTLCRSNLNPYCLGRKAAFFFQWAFKYTYLPLRFTTLRLAGGISIHYVLLR
jgi:hypothetical protein